MDHFNQSGQGAAEAATPAHSTGLDAGRELFALTDEQILEIEPEGRGEAAATAAPAELEAADASTASGAVAGAATTGAGSAGLTAAVAPGAEPPKWLAEVMADPERGGEARDFWNGVAQARQDAAAYREVFAGPAEARAGGGAGSGAGPD